MIMPLPVLATCQVTLAWDSNSEPELAGYRLYMREENGDYDYDNPEWQGSLTQCTVSQLDEYTVYYFIVRAFDANDDESDDSNEVRYANAEIPLALDNGTGSSVEAGISNSGGCFIGSLIAP
jgi:hypothetical protein